MKLFGKKTQELNKGDMVEEKKSLKDKYMTEVDPSQIQGVQETPATPEVTPEVAPVAEPAPVAEVNQDLSIPVVPVEPALADTEIKPVFDTPQTDEDSNKLIDKFTNVVDPN